MPHLIEDSWVTAATDKFNLRLIGCTLLNTFKCWLLSICICGLGCGLLNVNLFVGLDVGSSTLDMGLRCGLLNIFRCSFECLVSPRTGGSWTWPTRFSPISVKLGSSLCCSLYGSICAEFCSSCIYCGALFHSCKAGRCLWPTQDRVSFCRCCALISQNVLIHDFQKVNAPAKSLTCCLLTLIQTLSWRCLWGIWHSEAHW